MLKFITRDKRKATKINIEKKEMVLIGFMIVFHFRISKNQFNAAKHKNPNIEMIDLVVDVL